MQAPKVLLLQARHFDDPAKAEELQTFVRRTGLPEGAVVAHDLLAGPPSLGKVRSHDALMMGGSGEFYVSKADLPHWQALLELLGEAVEVGHPTYASCFGFQCMVVALGGEIVHDPHSTEVGTYELSLTQAGRHDALFGYLPDTFRAQMGRKDRAQRLPPGVVHLASSERSPFQAFRIPDKPVWASQFHPELDRETNLQRYRRYLDGYATYLSPAERRDTLQRFSDSPEANEMLPRFLKLVLGWPPGP